MVSQASLFTTDALRAFSQERKEPDWLLERRQAALTLHEKQDLPQWKRTDPRKFDFPDLASRAVKGSLKADLASPGVEGVIVMDLAEAAREHEDLVKPFLLTTAIRPEEGKVETMHTAFWNAGTFMYIPKGVELAEPLVADTTVGAGGVMKHTLILADPLSKVSVVERQRSADAQDPGFVTNFVEILAREGSHVDYASVQDLNLETQQLTRKRAIHEKDASVNWMDAQFGTKLSQGKTESLLGGPGSSTKNVGAFFGAGSQHFDLEAAALHRARATSSDLNTKGALMDTAYASYYALVNIGHGAPEASGHQKANTLLLSDTARADSIPKLDVENNQVSASHAATVGQVDKEQLFYLRSRGFDEKSAKRVIVEGFFEPLIAEIPLEHVQDDIRKLIDSRMA